VKHYSSFTIGPYL